MERDREGERDIREWRETEREREIEGDEERESALSHLLVFVPPYTMSARSQC